MSVLSVHSDEHFMNQALQQAHLALEAGEIPVGAVVVSNNRVIARAHNQVQLLNDATAHAEMLALTAAQEYLGAKYLQQCTLYVTLEPCVMCAGATYWSQVERIVYGAADPQKGFGKLCPELFPARTKISGGLMNEACAELVNAFFSRIRNNK